ncbi:hypothetical protein GGF46_004952 [Coemansia sp. RSA 552]|nr:hypothetical protein GGF46_004952 [Coemansia sp. RSA 552]
MSSPADTVTSSLTALLGPEATPLAAKAPVGDDTFFSDWVTPGLVMGLIVTFLFIVLVMVGVSWLASIQTPKNLPSTTKQKKFQ